MIISCLIDTDELETIDNIDEAIGDLEEALAALKVYRTTKIVSEWTHRGGTKVYKMNYSQSLNSSITKADKEYMERRVNNG